MRNRFLPATSTIRVGQSVFGRPIVAHRFGRSDGNSILVLGGFHGDEPNSVTVCRLLIDELSDEATKRRSADDDSSPIVASRPTLSAEVTKRRSAGGRDRAVRRRTGETPLMGTTLGNINWCIVPVVNLDGYERRTRRNANKVDLNRNFPASNWELGRANSRMFGGVKPASEPETRAVMRLIERIDPVAIITIHSISHGRHCNNYDGPGRRLAQSMSRVNGYPVTATIGYPTPGSFGTWAGVERGCPLITLELPTDRSIKKIWAENRLALLRGVPRGLRSP